MKKNERLQPNYPRHGTNQPDTNPLLRKRWILFTKIMVFVLLVSIPFIVYRIKAAEKEPDPFEFVRQYQVPREFNQADIDLMMEQMKYDREYRFHFQINTPEEIKKTGETAFQILKANPTQKALEEKIFELHKKIEGSGHLLYYMQFSDEFIRNPDVNEELKFLVRDFLSTDFILTILGLHYKATYNPQFSFQWEQSTYLASLKVREAAARWTNH